MSLYNDSTLSGVKLHRNRFSLKNRKGLTCDFGIIYPAVAKFMIPGDTFKITNNILIRLQPMLAPSLTPMTLRMRYFFIPLRLLDDNTEQIITGSKNGKLLTGELPTFPTMFGSVPNSATIQKYSFCDYMGFPTGVSVEYFKGKDFAPAEYWWKAYLRCVFDYYQDENLRTQDDFDDFYSANAGNSVRSSGMKSVCLKKDYFTSSLPFQLKGVAPSFNVFGHTNFINLTSRSQMGAIRESDGIAVNPIPGTTTLYGLGSRQMEDFDYLGIDVRTTQGVTAQDMRSVFAQTRVFERLARCGSRYVEYLTANFGLAPADGTLQRAQYLGGFKQPIVVTDIAQTGGNEDDSPTGMLRGKGISNMTNSIRPFTANEFGVLFGLFDVMPEITYTQGVPREFSYKSRWDFFNPSFQNLSEQAIRNGEIYVNNGNDNDDTFGFTPMYEELRVSQNIVTSDLRDSLSYWTQAISWSSRPYLNNSFISSANYLSCFKQPFTVIADYAKPLIVDCFTHIDAYRPLVRRSIPGLIDHN